MPSIYFVFIPYFYSISFIILCFLVGLPKPEKFIWPIFFLIVNMMTSHQEQSQKNENRRSTNTMKSLYRKWCIFCCCCCCLWYWSNSSHTPMVGFNMFRAKPLIMSRTKRINERLDDNQQLFKYPLKSPLFTQWKQQQQLSS